MERKEGVSSGQMAMLAIAATGIIIETFAAQSQLAPQARAIVNTVIGAALLIIGMLSLWALLILRAIRESNDADS